MFLDQCSPFCQDSSYQMSNDKYRFLLEVGHYYCVCTLKSYYTVLNCNQIYIAPLHDRLITGATEIATASQDRAERLSSAYIIQI